LYDTLKNETELRAAVARSWIVLHIVSDQGLVSELSASRSGWFTYRIEYTFLTNAIRISIVASETLPPN
jgi:hypothetical protein